jgi:hypothetical protein
MFVCFANLWEIEVFFGKSLGCTGGLNRSLRAFFEEIWVVYIFWKG